MNYDVFYILSISKKEVTLYRCDTNGIREIKIEGMPIDLKNALGEEFLDKQLQQHSAGNKASTIYHGQGTGKDHEINNLIHYFRDIDRSICNYLKSDKSTLMLAAVDYLVPIYKKVSKYSYIHNDFIRGNPEHLSDKDLYAKAWKILYPLTER